MDFKQKKEQILRKNLSFQMKNIINKVCIKIQINLTCKIIKNKKIKPIKFSNVKTHTCKHKNHK